MPHCRADKDWTRRCDEHFDCDIAHRYARHRLFKLSIDRSRRDGEVHFTRLSRAELSRDDRGVSNDDALHPNTGVHPQNG